MQHNEGVLCVRVCVLLRACVLECMCVGGRAGPQGVLLHVHQLCGVVSVQLYSTFVTGNTQATIRLETRQTFHSFYLQSSLFQFGGDLLLSKEVVPQADRWRQDFDPRQTVSDPGKPARTSAEKQQTLFGVSIQRGVVSQNCWEFQPPQHFYNQVRKSLFPWRESWIRPEHSPPCSPHAEVSL